jgi:hypothetical protein
VATVAEQLVAKLNADGAVTALVSGRIYPSTLPQAATLPAIVYTVVSDVPENSLDGTVATRLRSARVQVDCYARNSADGGGYLASHAVADAVENVIGNLSDPSLNSTPADKRDLFDNETTYFRVSMDFIVWH